jgi:hypothetical protein
MRSFERRTMAVTVATKVAVRRLHMWVGRSRGMVVIVWRDGNNWVSGCVGNDIKVVESET